MLPRGIGSPGASAGLSEGCRAPLRRVRPRPCCRAHTLNPCATARGGPAGETHGPGIADSGIDPLTSLERWVEEGKAPTELIATKMAPTGNQTLWRRPVCAYPKIARYNGSGDPTDATSFTCTEP
jgi:hypothetical protein